MISAPTIYQKVNRKLRHQANTANIGKRKMADTW